MAQVYKKHFLKLFQVNCYGKGYYSTTTHIKDAKSELIHTVQQFVREEVIPKISKYDESMEAYAVTEPEAGSDLGNIKTTAELKNDEYILNGEKAWITNSSIADWYFVLARTAKDEKTPSSKAFTGFIVDNSIKGVSYGTKRCSETRSLFLDNVKVPKENIVGEVGHGFELAMKAFDRTRPVIAALACGLSKRAFEESLNYGKQRKTFAKSIINYQGISFKIAEMAINLEAARALTAKSAEMVDAGNKNATYYSSCSKSFATDTAFQAAASAVQIFGANGVSMDYPVEKLLRDAKSLQMYGGTSEIQHLIISKKIFD